MVAMVDDNDGALRRPAKAGLALIVMLMLPTWRGITARRRATMKGVRVTLGRVTYDVSFDCKGNPAAVMGYYVRDGGRIVWAKNFGVRPARRIQAVIAAAIEVQKANAGWLNSPTAIAGNEAVGEPVGGQKP